MHDATAREDSEMNLRQLEEVCHIREHWLHRQHNEVAAAHAIAHTTAMAIGAWGAAEQHCQRLVEQYLMVYPDWHPISGLQMYTLAELKEKNGAFNEACLWYQRAKHVLHITHGEDHDMVQGLKERLR